MIKNGMKEYLPKHITEDLDKRDAAGAEVPDLAKFIAWKEMMDERADNDAKQLIDVTTPEKADPATSIVDPLKSTVAESPEADEIAQTTTKPAPGTPAEVVGTVPPPTPTAPSTKLSATQCWVFQRAQPRVVPLPHLGKTSSLSLLTHSRSKEEKASTGGQYFSWPLFFRSRSHGSQTQRTF